MVGSCFTNDWYIWATMPPCTLNTCNNHIMEFSDRMWANFVLVCQLWQRGVSECLSEWRGMAWQISDPGRIIWKSPKWLLTNFKTKLLWFMNCERKIKRKRWKFMFVACTDVSSHVQCLVGQSKQRLVVKISMCFNTKENNATLSVEITLGWNARITENIKSYHS